MVRGPIIWGGYILKSEDIKEYSEFFRESYYSAMGLLVSLGAIASFFVVSDDFIKQGVTSFQNRLICYSLFCLLWISIWLIKRNSFPKNKKNRIGIFLCIQYENRKQKIRIENDIVNNIRSLLPSNKLNELIDVIVMNGFQSKKASGVLLEHSTAINEIRALDEKGQPHPTELRRIINRGKKFENSLKGHLYIWGQINERQSEKNCYILDIRGLIVHKAVQRKVWDRIKKDFMAVLPTRFSFFESLESIGFELVARQITIASKYMLGIACTTAGDFNTAFKLHKTLRTEIDSLFRPLPPGIADISRGLGPLVADELYFIATDAYYKKNDISKVKTCLSECLKLQSNHYGATLLAAIIEFSINKNLAEAIKQVERAQRFAPDGDLSWLYSRAFLNMFLGRFPEGLHDYRQLENSTEFQGEADVLRGCIEFNQQVLQREPVHIECNFILGALHKKSGNFPLSLEHFEKFMGEASRDQKYSPLIEATKQTINELKKEMNLPTD